jgi:hypothetical protein
MTGSSLSAHLIWLYGLIWLIQADTAELPKRFFLYWFALAVVSGIVDRQAAAYRKATNVNT